jgi:ribosomal-protein-alanine N-acetyltransferase
MSYIMQTKRLGLRRWEDSDLTQLADMNADKKVMQHFPNVMSTSETRSMLERIRRHHNEYGYGLYATEIIDTGEFIGFIGFSHPRFKADFTPCVEIGWRLQSAYWNKGYCTEGAMACLDYYKHTLKKTEIYSWTSVLNKPSERIMQKIGMEKIGEFLHPLLDRNSHLAQHVIYKKILVESKKANPN